MFCCSQVVDLTLRLQPSYEPKFVAEDLLAEQCATAIRSDSNASAIARQWKHAAEEAEASASPESSLTPSQMDVGDLLPEARQAVMELRDDICEKHRLTFRKIFKATPGLYRSSRAPPLLKMAFVKILNQGPQIGVAQAARPAPLGVLLLTSSCLEVYEELVDAESPCTCLFSVLLALGSRASLCVTTSSRCVVLQLIWWPPTTLPSSW